VTGDLQGLVNALLKALKGVFAGLRALDGFWETCIRFRRLVDPACQVFLTSARLNYFRENGLSEVPVGLRCDRKAQNCGQECRKNFHSPPTSFLFLVLYLSRRRRCHPRAPPGFRLPPLPGPPWCPRRHSGGT